VQTLILGNGQAVVFPECRAVPERDGMFILSIRKSGSTLLAKVIEMISEATKTQSINVGDTLFNANVSPVILHNDAAINEILVPGVMYFEFRDYPSVMEKSEVFRRGKKVMLVRDPRDALVSEYFSMAFSHNVPVTKEGQSDLNARHIEQIRAKALSSSIDDFVVERADAFVETAIRFHSALREPNIVIIKYEDIIFDKLKLVRTICEYFGLQISPAKITRIARAADIIPSFEDPKAHIRQAIPGDHVKKLKPETIRQLDIILRPVLESFGYRV
jgi:hypothetical protein